MARTSTNKAKPATTIGIFPFDLFGGGGAARGAELIADALNEMLADNRRERQPSRARAYQDQVAIHEFHFEKLNDYQDWRATAARFIRRTLADQRFLIWISGNHLGALPIYEELAAEHADTLVIQFDAHLDIYNLSDCTRELSHGNFLLHCVAPLPPLVNVGHRELLLTDEHIDHYYLAHFPADELAARPQAVLRRVKAMASKATRVFIDLDCDVLDPAYFPALSHPQPFGLSPTVLLALLDAVWSDKVIGLAVSEFDPGRDQNDRSLALVLWLVEYVLLRRHEGEKKWR